MTVTSCEFYSDGLRLEGVLHAPEKAGSGRKYPVIVVCSGLHGLKEWVPPRWCPFILEAGFLCFAFDYRGFGTSAGERGRMLPEEEVRDVLAAVAYLRTLPQVDPERIALVGWGLGGGVAIAAAARDSRIAAVCCANGAGDYGRTVRDAIPYMTWLQWLDILEEDRGRRATTGASKFVDYRNITNPNCTDDYQHHGQFYKDLNRINQAPIEAFTLETCDAYVNFRPEDVVGRIAPRPIFFLHGAKNYFMPVDEARSLYERAGEPRRLHIVPDGKHLEMIDPENPGYAPTLRAVMDWFKEVLTPLA